MLEIALFGIVLVLAFGIGIALSLLAMNKSVMAKYQAERAANNFRSQAENIAATFAAETVKRRHAFDQAVASANAKNIQHEYNQCLLAAELMEITLKELAS